MSKERTQSPITHLSSKAREAIRESPIKPGDKVVISKGARKGDKEYTINRLAFANERILFFVGESVYHKEELTKIEPSTPITSRIEIKFK